MFNHEKQIFAASVPPTCNEALLLKIFSVYGEIEYAVIKKRENGSSFAFVSFKNKDSVVEAVKSNPHFICGTSVEVRKSVNYRNNSGQEMTNTSSETKGKKNIGIDNGYVQLDVNKLRRLRERSLTVTSAVTAALGHTKKIDLLADVFMNFEL
ncbi:hypothetical protein ACOME3_000200 [Neoechinorhynchus agilis]